MAIIFMVVGAIALVWLAVALALCALRRCSFHQAFLLAPIAVWHRLTVNGGEHLRSKPPVLYAVLHQSHLDPALMLSLLPNDTLHILDEQSARSAWLEPWREAARTIAFNPEHFFVSRRLVRHLKGNGRLAVYFPDGIEPDTKPYRLYRAVARIAQRSGAEIVPVSVHGSRRTMFAPASNPSRRPLKGLKVVALEARTIPDLVQELGGEKASAAAALYGRVKQADEG